MNSAPESKAPPGIVRRLVRLKGFLVAISLVGLVASNLATLLSASFYDRLYTGVRKVALLAGEAVADRVTRHSKKAQADERLRKETQDLRDRKARVDAELEETKARQARTSVELEERRVETQHLRDQKAQVDAELKEAKVQSAKTSEELANERATAGRVRQELDGVKGELDGVKARRALDAKSAKEAAGRVQKRLVAGVARNTAAIPAEAIPYVGIGVNLSVTALDIYDACQTMGEINSLLTMLGQGVENSDFCGQKLPTKEEVVAGIKDEWRRSIQFVADQARKVPTQVPVPQVRVPTVDEAMAVACSIVALPGC
ncbi:MAG: hypothetical protein IPM30_14920 [Burkholderiales bacterium]|nr:hypothetical protein [Burkholderiales bacterium]